jgi:hypothetical protein
MVFRKLVSSLVQCIFISICPPATLKGGKFSFFFVITFIFLLLSFFFFPVASCQSPVASRQLPVASRLLPHTSRQLPYNPPHLLKLLFHTHHQTELSPGSLKIMKRVMYFEVVVTINIICKKTNSNGIGY